uniref:Uncharacterized protein n=1 Tax=viral metagenome TaxID=1070528 RepID=A0A6M3LE27_9ZZZZ
MEAPKCRACGVRHWGLCTVFHGNPENQTTTILRSVSQTTETVVANNMANKKGGDASDRNIRSDHVLKADANVGGSASDSKTRTYQYRDSEKRKAYMKEYMKKKRVSKIGGK